MRAAVGGNHGNSCVRFHGYWALTDNFAKMNWRAPTQHTITYFFPHTTPETDQTENEILEIWVIDNNWEDNT
eukprot:2849806-Ditylum_brightwellii.AAC.1